MAKLVTETKYVSELTEEMISDGWQKTEYGESCKKHIRILEKVKSFLNKNGVVYSDETDGGICITDMAQLKSRLGTKEWKEFWDSTDDKLVHSGSINTEKRESKWIIKEIN